MPKFVELLSPSVLTLKTSTSIKNQLNQGIRSPLLTASPRWSSGHGHRRKKGSASARFATPATLISKELDAG